MATYYSSTNNQRDSTPILYVREPFPNSYTESPALPPGNMLMYANYASSSASYSDTLAVNPEPQHSCLEIPPIGPSDSTHPQQEILSHLGESRINYNGSWRDERDEMSFMNPTVAQNQGLSLSLSTQIQFRNPSSSFSSFLSPHMAVATEDENSMNKQSSNTQYFPPSFPGGSQDSYGMSNIARAVPNSKYLKAAQQLLDEVVNVRRALKPTDFEKKMWKEGDGRVKNGVVSPSVSGGPSNPKDGNSHCEISASERQDLQNKLTKLLSMLDEVDRRYKQYYHQMQIVVSSFDVISGCGAAKPYTALALQTISRHFRCLRDAITGQIRVTRKNLGEQDVSTNGKGVGISRLRYVDQQLRQQRAIQQLGMMQQHTWRPQRGLPETSVSILRAWLFEHFLHPYPKDSDKIMLARQTGLTRSQVSNWFINARVRLWKPMVEEMYKEEIGDAEMDSNSSSENASKPTRTDPQPSEERVQDVQQQSTTSTACGAQFFDSRSDHIPSSEMSSAFQDGTHRGTDAEYGAVKYRGGSERLMAAATAYQMPELGSFGNGGGVSLTLGLQHCEGVGLPMPGGAHHGLVTMRGGDDVYSASASSAMPGRVDFDCIDPGDVQPRFSSSHLLHDFVA